jgi:hypothetical protein
MFDFFRRACAPKPSSSALSGAPESVAPQDRSKPTVIYRDAPLERSTQASWPAAVPKPEPFQRAGGCCGEDTDDDVLTTGTARHRNRSITDRAARPLFNSKLRSMLRSQSRLIPDAPRRPISTPSPKQELIAPVLACIRTGFVTLLLNG